LQLRFEKRFFKDYKKLPKHIQKAVYEYIDVLEEVENIDKITNLKKMKGQKSFYRIRLSSFRLGFRLNEDHLIIMRVGPRGGFYKDFPPKV